MVQQTAVEYLFMMLANHNILNHKLLADNKHLTELTYKIKTEAKEMQKHQQKLCWDAAHQAGRFEGKGIAEENWQTFEGYYNETYGKTNGS